MTCHSGPYDCHLGKNDHDINKTCISPHIYLPPYSQLKKVLRKNRHLDREIQNELILELEAAKGKGRINICVRMGD